MFKARIAEGITKEGLLAIHPGMAGEVVVALVGEPISKKDGTWIYGKPSILDNGLEIFINMSNSRVSAVSVEDHDLGVYSYQENGKQEIWKDELLEQLPKRDVNHH